MADVVLTTDELLVLSGPSSVNVEVDFGPEGERGSLFFVSVGNPNTALTGQNPKAKDLCVNILKTDNEYSYVYQYNSDGANGFQWYPIIKLSPLQYNKILTGTFVDGSKVFNIPVSYIVDEETSQTLTSANFNITYSIPNENPIASSIEIGSFTNDPVSGLQVLPVTINAVEYASSTWQDLTGVKTVHFVISIVV
ncbi:hypothetical protein UFOVP828_54 [uncultured Caudovirales phage]|uniref:Uncharacterized protein n=1 Tax=uncultured Caudovirales phage TaxID=2100421 RepID=A0A6J5NY82_9CAUD|nr:hypothetical protein UFOVP828_54 [uncultured Caudovirales phage]